MKKAVITVHDFKQRSEEWEAIRVGKVGGSEAVGLTTATRMKTLIWRKVAELLTGKQEEVFVSEAMQYGIDNESVAIANYEAENLCEVEEVGYITNSDFKYLGLSPDRMIGLKKGIEVKCPMPKKLVETVITNQVPTGNRPQLALYFLVVPEMETISFLSFNDEVRKYPQHEIIVTREEFTKDIDKLKKGYLEYEAKVDEYLKMF